MTSFVRFVVRVRVCLHNGWDLSGITPPSSFPPSPPPLLLSVSYLHLRLSYHSNIQSFLLLDSLSDAFYGWIRRGKRLHSSFSLWFITDSQDSEKIKTTNLKFKKRGRTATDSCKIRIMEMITRELIMQRKEEHANINKNNSATISDRSWSLFLSHHLFLSSMGDFSRKKSR